MIRPHFLESSYALYAYLSLGNYVTGRKRYFRNSVE